MDVQSGQDHRAEDDVDENDARERLRAIFPSSGGVTGHRRVPDEQRVSWLKVFEALIWNGRPDL